MDLSGQHAAGSPYSVAKSGAVSRPGNIPDRLPLTIAILSFNRPNYLAAVLQSLQPQLMEGDEVFLFQDGGWNPYSRTSKAPEPEIDKCIEVFSDIMLSEQRGFDGCNANCRMFRHHINYGIALNYYIAETYIFNMLRRRHAVFLEDDLLLSDNYLSVISGLIGIAQANPRIGYVSAYGNLWASLAEQEENKDVLIKMHENWGFALTLESWKAQTTIRGAYLGLVSGCDYRYRNSRTISEYFAKLGYNCRYTTQDSARWIACHAAGMVRLTTYTCHARYIGAVGEHSSDTHYSGYGFGHSVFYPAKPLLRAPAEEEINGWLREDAENFRNGYEHDYIRRASLML
jgi:hypothetical protein